MSGHQEEQPERARALLMAALDGELSSVEQAEFEQLLASDAAFAAEWKRLETVKEVTGTMTFRQPPEEVWDRYWEGTYRRFERGLGWVLFSLGLFGVLAWSAWHAVHAWLADSVVPGWVKIALVVALVGGAILFASVVRERWFTSRHDRYREVQR